MRDGFSVHVPADHYQFCAYRHVSVYFDDVVWCSGDVVIDRDGQVVQLR